MFKNILLFVVAVCVGIRNVNSISYDAFSGRQISSNLLDYYKKVNITHRCISEFEPCDPNEPRRVNGTCNNLRYPTSAGINTPPRRVLPPVFSGVDNARKSQCGDDLPLERRARQDLLCTGKVSSGKYTQLVTHIIVYIFIDIGSTIDSGNYVAYTRHCCEPGQTFDPYKVCDTRKIPSDDAVHRFSHYRCQNQTKPMTYQRYGCHVKTNTPIRVVPATNIFDLSSIYDFRFLVLEADKFYDKRSYVNGSLKHDIDENGIIWPPSIPTLGPQERNDCGVNVKPRETRCHQSLANGVFGTNLFSIWFYRNHLRIAAHLAEINPCWNDNKLFHVAADINISIYLQIMFYEVFSLLFGKKNLVRDGVISNSPLHRDVYDESLIPSMSEEFMFAMRWFHTMQDSTLKQYDTDGNFVKTFPIGNLTSRTGYLAVDNNLAQLTQGSFRQACGNNDYVVHPDMVDVGIGPLQPILDILTNDLAKSRLLGFQPYIKYREFCTNRKYNTWDDLANDIRPENLERLKEVYKDVNDIDLLAGMWLEEHIKGGEVPATVYCLMVEQLYLSVRHDRFWYERPNRPYAFTSEQLRQIRKATVARLLCDVGDGVTQIQPQAFYRIGPFNRLRNCEDLPKADLNAWKDESCRNWNY